MPKAGLEPARRELRLILSQVRLPIPPLRHIKNYNIANDRQYTIVQEKLSSYGSFLYGVPYYFPLFKDEIIIEASSLVIKISLGLLPILGPMIFTSSIVSIRRAARV